MTHRDDGYIALATEANDHDNHEHVDHEDPSFLSPADEQTPIAIRSIGTGTFIILSHGKGYSYSYGPGGLTGLKHNTYALTSAIFASIGGLLFGYDQGVIANVLVMKEFTRRWPVGPWDAGLMTAMLEFGALIGAFLAGTFTDKYSRQWSIFLACAIFCIGSVLQCGAQSLEHLIVGRAIGGVGIGSLSMLSPLYMAEISPPEVRGSLMSLEQFSIVLGVVLGFWTGFLTRDIPNALSWRTPLAVQIIPGLILGFGCFFLPSSPRLLVLQGKDEAAKKTLARLRTNRSDAEYEDNPLLKIEFLEMQVEALMTERSSATRPDERQRKDSQSHITREVHEWRRLFGKKYIDRTLIGIIIMIFQQWSGINALLYYGPILMRKIGLEGDTIVLVGSGGVGIVQFFAVVPAILYIDRLGRKPLLFWGGIAMGVSHLLIAIVILLYRGDWTSHHFGAWFAVGCTYAFTAAYGLSYGPVSWILPSEVLPLSIRSRGAAAATMSNWINNFFIGLVTPICVSISPSATFLVFAAACFCASFWSRYCVPETAGVSLEEIDRLFFKSEVAREDEEIRKTIGREIGLDSLVAELSTGHC